MNYSSKINFATSILTIINFVPGFFAGCPASWGRYVQENVCVKAFSEPKNWTACRDLCETNNGDLVQIFTFDKENFVKGKRQSNNSVHWIGVSDVDHDGTFEYVNGTKLVTPRPGIGKWQRGGKKDNFFCVSLAINDVGWNLDECDKPRNCICEIDLNTNVVKEQPRCNETTCVCETKDWLYFKPGKTFIILNPVEADFSTSAHLCRKLGGQLVIVPSKEKEKFIKNARQWWSDRHMFYWMGLTLNDKLSKAKKDSVWQWIDGKILGDSSNRNWYAKPSKDHECAVVMWDNNAQWRSTLCSSLNYHICEADVPCSSRPAFTINNGTILENASLAIQDELKVDVLCFASGFVENLESVTLTCEWNKIGFAVGSRHVFSQYVIDSEMHGKYFECRSIDKNGTHEVSKVSINYTCGPRFVKQKEASLHVKIKEGKSGSIVFYVMVNPLPNDVTVTRQESKSPVDIFNIAFEPFSKALYFTVFVIIAKFQKSYNGSYRIALSNGIGKKLEIDFSVKGEHGHSEGEDKSIMSVIIYGLIILSVVLVIFFGLWFLVKSRSKSKKRFSTRASLHTSSKRSTSVESDETHNTTVATSTVSGDDDGDDEDDDDDDDVPSYDEQYGTHLH